MTKYALCVGTNYPGTSSELRGAVQDANDWAATLNARGFQTAERLNQYAGRAAILGTLEDMLTDSGPDDLAVVTWSGHGTRVPDRDGDETDGWDEAIVPHDYRTAGFILDDHLYRLFAPAEARGVRVVFISDSCHSGTMQRLAPPLALGPSEPRGMETIRPMGTIEASYRRARWLSPAEWMNPEDLRRAAPAWTPPRGVSRRSALVLAACRDTQVAFDAFIGGRYRGAFTAAALAALETLEAGTASELNAIDAGFTPTRLSYRQWHKAIRTILPSVDFDSVPQIDGTAAQRRWLLFAEQGRR